MSPPSASLPLCAMMATASHSSSASITTPAPAAVVVRSSVRRQQMETRLRLRRRLLRITDSDSRDADDEAEDTDKPTVKAVQRTMSGSKKTKGFPPTTRRENKTSIQPEDSNSDVDEDGDEDENEDDEEDDEADGDDEVVETTSTPLKNEKSVQSAIVKLLFSRSDPRGRAPTVWFDYPPHLQVTREPPLISTGSVNRLISVNATECEIFYKTHWERNCVKNAFAVAGFRRTKKKSSHSWHVAWAKHVPRDKFRMLKENQAFSHFPDPWVIGRKDRLMKTLTTYKRRLGASYAFFPEGFTLPDHLDAFKRATSNAPTSLWILKPPAAACGKGIRVVPAKDVDTFLTHEKRRERKYIAQRYIVNPLLVDGFKFDLRIYVLVTSVDPLRIYLFQEGLTRFCTTPYSLANTKNRFAHLTNYSVNKNNKLFVENTNADSDNTGNKWSMTALLEHLKSQGLVQDIQVVRQKMKDIICKTIIAAEAHLTPLMHQFVKGFRTQNIKCFELFGFDMMLDDTCTPWLIEANVSPSLMAGSPLDRKIKGLLLSDIFHLVGVPVPKETLPPNAILDTLQGNASANEMGTTIRPGGVNKQLHEIALDAKRPVFEKKDLELFSSADWNMIYDMEDEMERLGHFERIFPCESAQETAKYAPYFTCPRYSNALCIKWNETKNRTRAKAAAAQALGKKPPTKSSRSNSFGGPTTRAPIARTHSVRGTTPRGTQLVSSGASR